MIVMSVGILDTMAILRMAFRQDAHRPSTRHGARRDQLGRNVRSLRSDAVLVMEEGWHSLLGAFLSELGRHAPLGTFLSVMLNLFSNGQECPFSICVISVKWFTSLT